MARTAERLTARAVQTARAEERARMLADGKGLYLHVAPTGARSWIFRYRSAGRRHDLGLGPYPDITLADARERAAEQRKLRLNGHDPLLTRRAGSDQKRAEAAKRMTFRQCADAYIAAHRAGWRHPKHAQQWVSSLARFAFPAIGNLPVQLIDVALVMRVVEPMWTTMPETASRVRGRIEMVLDWATTSGYRSGDNPARWRGHMENLLPQKRKVRRTEHLAALPYAEVGAFMAALRQQDDIGARPLEFAILTASRTSGVIGARWDEFDLAERLWTIPAERMKAAKEHRVPLSPAALAIVEKMAESSQGEFVFPGGRQGQPVSKMAMLVTLQRMGRADITVHGFRSTFRDWCAERTNFPAEVAEMALAHTVSDKVEAAYRRGDLFAKRRQLADAWARYCTQPATAGGEVVAIGAVA